MNHTIRKQTLRSAYVVLLLSSSFVAFNGGSGGNNNNSTGTDSSSTTTDATNNINKMGDSSSVNRMADSVKRDTGGRNTQDVPPPKPKKTM